MTETVKRGPRTKAEVKECAREGCGEKFVPVNARQKFHDRACKELDKTARSRRIEPTPEAKSTATLERKLLTLEASKTSAVRIANAAKLELATAVEARDRALFELDVLAQKTQTLPGWLAPNRKTTRQHYGTLLTAFSDLHAGEVVMPGEIDGYNKYNLAIAELRTERFFRRTITVARNYLAGVKYDGIVLALLGDLVSGDIHDELVETNECSTLESIYLTVPWLVKGIEMLADEFGRVHVVSAPGNHGRNSKKPRHKRRSENNADTLIAKLVARDMAAASNISFDIPTAADVGFTIYDSVFTAEHGDDMKFNGTSEIGSIGPVKRGTLRTGRQMQQLGKPFDYMILGHYHQLVPAYTQGFVMNGSVKGYDEYAKRGKFAPEIAQQFLGVVTPEHGISVSAPVFVADRDAEGW